MNCPVCERQMAQSTGDHNYKESGLDNVTLKGIELYTCDCGEKLVSIPCIPELHTLIGERLLKKLSILNGKEVRFLRKNIGLRANIFAEILGVDRSTVSRWENGKQKMEKAHDRLIRVTYANLKGVDAEAAKDLITGIFPGIKTESDGEVPVLLLVNDWANQSACKKIEP
jgi:putative zinc finger/helix-turn-helix YgiT family protein